MREDIKNLISDLGKNFSDIKRNLFGSLNNSDKLFIWDKEKIR